jgi:hypothetical protein
MPDISIGDLVSKHTAMVWEPEFAPAEIKALDTASDVDYYALIPPSMLEGHCYISWLEHLGPNRVEEHEIGNGWKVFIGYHA